jgi:hypothetical protein
MYEDASNDVRRLVRRLLAHKLLECEVLNRTRAEPAIHIATWHPLVVLERIF